MTHEKFESEINTLKKFYELYCIDKHENQKIRLEVLEYKEKKFFLELNLCPICYEAISYSFNRLQGCPHDIKPRCRTCPAPCYEKQKWKEAARVMKYSAIKLSLGKIKSRVINIFSNSTKE
ncbi:putative nitrous oxide-regulated protein [Aliarcobacter faecis]|uniref:nitrous oxide-stimulated promoter family protein n=1 Tax=Aliarcobacter faecis TaxID=1564138 RepID=UPI0004791F88|nr:nitrous oxide-stimulated promoter family protein [Aliarcobacter faecis]QKF72269.1 putative nitrous oxide-regulated protein [Aliarcobacter faecis]